MKHIAIICGTLLASCVWAQDFSKKITFECKAMPADQVLPQIAKLSGIQMSADPSMAGDILLISIKDASIGEFMKRLAKLTDAQWTSDGGAYVLSPDAARRTDEVNKDLKERQDAVTAMLAEIQKQSLPPGPRSLLALQDPAVIARIGQGDRVVFSSDPTGAQIAGNGITSDFVTALLTPPAPPLGAQNGTAQDQQSQRQPSKAILAVSNQSNTINVHLIVYDQNGAQLASQEESVNLHQTPKPMAVPASVDKPDTAEVQMSKGTEALEKVGFDSFSTKPSELDKDTLDLVLHPDKNDPLSFFASDALLQRAQECGDQLIADLPDSIVVERAPTAKQYLDEESQRGHLAAQEDNGWMVIGPANPALARVERANRTALATLVQEAQKKGDPCLTDMALFAVADGHPPLGPEGEPIDASAPYIRTFVKEWQDFVPAENRFALLEFYGYLSNSQRRDIQSNQAIPVGELSDGAKNDLEYLTYGAYAHFRVEPPIARPGSVARSVLPNVVSSTPRRTRRYPGAFGQTSYLSEPTEALPNGVPADATVKLVVNASAPANNGAGGLNLFTFQFNLLPQVAFDQRLEEPAAGP